ncbi:MAG: nucleotide-binding protein [Thermoplasmatota archaeon]
MAASPNACLRCQAELESMGVEPFRVGGMGAAGHLFLGNLAEMSEERLRLEALACPSCGYVELRVPRNG